MDRPFPAFDAVSGHELAALLQASGNFSSSPISLQQQAYGQHTPMGSVTQMDFCSPSSYTSSARMPQGINANFDFTDGRNVQTYRNQQRYPHGQFYRPRCNPPNFQQKQQYPYSLPMQNLNPSSFNTQHNAQLSSVPRMHHQNSILLSPGQTGHLQHSRLPPSQGGQTQIPSMFSNSQPSSQQLNESAVRHSQYNSRVISSNTQCSYRNDPPLGNMHTMHSKTTNMDEVRQFPSSRQMTSNTYQPSGPMFDNKMNGNAHNAYNMNCVEDQRRGNRLASGIEQGQSKSAVSPHQPQRNTVTILLNSNRYPQFRNAHNNSQGSQPSGQPSLENVYNGCQQQQTPSLGNSSFYNHAIEKNSQQYPHHPSFSNSSSIIDSSSSIDNRSRSTHGASQQSVRDVTKFHDNRRSNAESSVPTLFRSEKTQDSQNQSTVTAANCFSVFSARPSAGNVGGIKTGEKAQVPRDDRIGGGKRVTEEILRNPNETVKSTSLSQWFKSPKSSLASSFQSDVEAMRADLAEYTAGTETVGNQKSAPTSVPECQKQQSTTRNSQSSRQSHFKQNVSGSASKEAALAVIQSQQEMIDNLNKSKSFCAVPVTKEAAALSASLETQVISKEPAPPPSTGIISAGTVGMERRKTCDNLYVKEKPKSTNGIHRQSSVETDTQRNNLQQSRQLTTNLMTLPSVSMSGKNVAQIPEGRGILPKDHISVLTVNKPPFQNENKVQVDNLINNAHHEKKKETHTHNINRSQTKLSSRTAVPLSIYSNKKPSCQRPKMSVDSKTTSAREKVFDMWRAGQVVGRSPARVRVRSRGGARVVHTPRNNIYSTLVVDCSVSNMEKAPHNENNGVKQTQHTASQNAATLIVEDTSTIKKSMEPNKSSKSLIYVMFHGHKLICLRSLHEAQLLLCQFQFECFPNKGIGSVNNCIDRALRIKKKGLDHPKRGKILNFLKANGYRVENIVQTINVEDARRVYHHMYGITKCSNATCVVELSHKPVDLDLLISPSKKSTLTREIMMRVKKEKMQDDMDTGTQQSTSTARPHLRSSTSNEHSREDISTTATDMGVKSQFSPKVPSQLQNVDISSPRSDHTVAYGGDCDSETSDIFVVHTSEDPHIIRQSGDGPMTGGLCNTIVGQLRSYRHNEENYLVVDDLCNLLGPSEFHDGVEKENIILYSCCQEIANFLNAINVDFAPLQSLQHTLVKEKDIGVHITDNNYVPVHDEAGLSNPQTSDMSRKRFKLKQEIMDDHYCFPKRAKRETAEVETPGEADLSEREVVPMENGQTSDENTAGFTRHESPNLGSHKRKTSAEEMASHSKQSNPVMLNPMRSENEFSSYSSSQNNLDESINDETPDRHKTSDQQALIGTMDDSRTKRNSNISPDLDKNTDGSGKDTSYCGLNRELKSNSNSVKPFIGNNTALSQETDDVGFGRPNSASTPESYKSSASQEIEPSPSIFSDPNLPTATSVPSLAVCTLPCDPINNKTDSGTGLDLEPRSRTSETAGCEPPALANSSQENTSSTSSDGECLLIDLECSGDSSKESPHPNKQILTALTGENSSDQNLLPDLSEEASTPPGDKHLKVSGCKLRNMLLKTKRCQDLTTDIVHHDKNSNLCASDEHLPEIESVRQTNNDLNDLSREIGSSIPSEKENVLPEDAGTEDVNRHNIGNTEMCQSGDVEEICRRSNNSTPDSDIIEIWIDNTVDKSVSKQSNTPGLIISNVLRDETLKEETEDPIYKKAMEPCQSLDKDVSSLLSSSASYVPQPVTSRTESASSEIVCSSNSTTSLSAQSVLMREKRLSHDDLEVMNTSSTCPIVVPPLDANHTRQFLSNAYEKLCTQNKALINVVHILRKELSTSKMEKEKAEREKEKAERMSKHYEGVIHDILSTFKNGDEEAPIVIDSDDP